MKSTLLMICLLLLVGGVSYSQEDSPPVLKGQYLGQEPPGDTPVPFLHEVFCSEYDLHGPPVFSVDGSEIYWTPMGDGPGGIQYKQQSNDEWSEPETLPVPFYVFDAGEPCVSPDGSRLYFTAHVFWSDERIMYAQREDDEWGDFVSAGDAVNSLNLHWQVSVNRKYDLYFQVRNDDLTDGMIYCSRYVDGEYQQPEKLGETINTEAWENFPFIAPDDSYLIFCRTTPNRGDDLFISYRDENGNWGEAINLESINSPHHDMYPVITPDGQYLFFLSWRNGGSCPFWVSTGILEDYGRTNSP